MHDKDKDKDKERSHILLAGIYCCWKNSSSNHLSRVLSSPMCKQIWNKLKPQIPTNCDIYKRRKTNRFCQLGRKILNFWKQAETICRVNTSPRVLPFTQIFSIFHAISQMFVIFFFVKLKIPLDFDLISCENFMSETDTSKLRPTFQFPAF